MTRRGMTQDEYDKKARGLKQRQGSDGPQIEQHQQNEVTTAYWKA